MLATNPQRSAGMVNNWETVWKTEAISKFCGPRRPAQMPMAMARFTRCFNCRQLYYRLRTLSTALDYFGLTATALCNRVWNELSKIPIVSGGSA
jgi:hypothetical protein